MNRCLFLLLNGILILLTGCTLAPEYTRPKAPIPDVWPAGEAYKGTKTTMAVPRASDVKWREFFRDRKLRKIIETALNNNRDLRLTALNVQKARALYGIQRAGLFPSFDSVGRGSKQRIPADLSATDREMTAEQYSVNLGTSSWEIDFFGRIRNLKVRALEEYLATEQARRSAQILLLSSVANAYLTLASDREQLKLAESTLKANEEAHKLIRHRYKTGLVSELDLLQAQILVDRARGDSFRFAQLSAQDENALNLLAGTPSLLPKNILPEDLSGLKPLKEISPVIFSEVLLSRPDILAAEHRLKATNANIGAARAAFFPRILLSTSAGTASRQLSGLFESGSGTWSFAPQIVMPVFDARLKPAYEATKVERKIALARYEKAIQTAFREVSDVLATSGTIAARISAQQSLVEAAMETYRLSNARYIKGIDSYLSVLDAQRTLFAAEQGLISMHYAKLANQVRLYAVLGGGVE